ncbi:hypothetical protein AAG906_036073 [Vitis piasezkii]
MKFEGPSEIQAISLPMILTPPYKNLIAQAHNRSCKTACFVLGMLSRVDPKLQVPQALCICPTEELAIQDGFKYDSLWIMKDIERSGAQCQVCTKSSLLLDCTCILEVDKIIARKIHYKLGLRMCDG